VSVAPASPSRHVWQSKPVRRTMPRPPRGASAA
jgi:hypothetical protein